VNDGHDTSPNARTPAPSHNWLLEVLGDLVVYAETRDLPEVARALERAETRIAAALDKSEPAVGAAEAKDAAAGADVIRPPRWHSRRAAAGGDGRHD